LKINLQQFEQCRAARRSRSQNERRQFHKRILPKTRQSVERAIFGVVSKLSQERWLQPASTHTLLRAVKRHKCRAPQTKTLPFWRASAAIFG
jgi:hypothetical protein